MKTEIQLELPLTEPKKKEAVPYDQGASAAYHGLRLLDCPYKYNTVEGQDWVHGYTCYMRGDYMGYTT